MALSNSNSRVGYVAYGHNTTDDAWYTSECLYSTPENAVKNLQWAFEVDEQSINTIRIELK